MSKQNVFVIAQGVNANHLYSFLHENKVSFMPIVGDNYKLYDFAIEYLGVVNDHCNVFVIGCDENVKEHVRNSAIEGDSVYEISRYDLLIDEFLSKADFENYIVFDNVRRYENNNLVSHGSKITAEKLIEICNAEDKNVKTVAGVKIATYSGILGSKRR